MSLTVTIICEAGDAEGRCTERAVITADTIRTIKDHPDASPRNGDLDTARHIAMLKGWTTTLGAEGLRDRCPHHSGRTRTRKRTP